MVKVLYLVNIWRHCSINFEREKYRYRMKENGALKKVIDEFVYSFLKTCYRLICRETIFFEIVLKLNKNNIK